MSSVVETATEYAAEESLPEEEKMKTPEKEEKNSGKEDKKEPQFTSTSEKTDEPTREGGNVVIKKDEEYLLAVAKEDDGKVKLHENKVKNRKRREQEHLLAVAEEDDGSEKLGGSSYDVLLGRRDSTTASLDDADDSIPNPSMDLPELVANFKSQGLTLRDLVVLSGAHTLGYSRCVFYRDHLYNETDTLDPTYAASLEKRCPPAGEDEPLASLDDTPTTVDTDYYQGLMQGRALLHTDQQLYQGEGGDSDGLVQYYAENQDKFWEDFGAAMLKMGGLSPLTGDDGEVREDCRVVNQG